MSYGKNPYEAPDAPIIVHEEKARRLPLHTATSLFCWALGGYHTIAASLAIFVFTRKVEQWGLRKATLYMVWPSPKPIVFLATCLLGSAAYFIAARLLWRRRGLPGLILCGTGIAFTYAFAWSLGPN